MRAIVQTGYGTPDVYSIADVETPLVVDDGVLVRVRAASLHPDVWHVMMGTPYLLRFMGSGLRRPKDLVPGTDMAGVVEAVGNNVKSLRAGDEVFGETVRGHQWKNGGAFAEYVAVRESALAKKPAGVTFEEAAAVPTSGFIALQAVRQEGQVKAGQRVLVNGAGGGVGSLSVQIAQGAGRDRDRGGSHQQTGPASHARRRSGDRFHQGRLHGRHPAPRRHRRHSRQTSVRQDPAGVAADGVYVLVGHANFGTADGKVLGGVPRAIGLTIRSALTKQLPGLRGARPAPDRLAVLTNLLASGKLRPIIDRAFPLPEIREAMRHLQSGDARGRIVLTV